MRHWLRACSVAATPAILMIGTARAQYVEGPAGPSPDGLGMPMEAVPIGLGLGPAFSSPLGGGQGYGYAPTAFWVRPGFQLGYYYGDSVSSPYRPGSLNAHLPRYGYFSSGEGPYVFPPRFPR